MLLSMTGISSLFGYQIQCHSLLFNATSQVFAYLMLSLQHYYRFHLIRQNSPPSAATISIYFCISLLITAFCGYHSTQAYCTFDNPTGFDYAQWWAEEVPVPTLLIGPKNYPPMLLYSYLLSGTTLACYLTVILFIVLMVLDIKKQTKILTPKTINPEKQFRKTLIAQTLIPFFFGVGPILSGQIGRLFNTSTNHIGNYIILFIGWYPFLNSLSTLIFIVPYRTYCTRILSSCVFRLTRNAVVNISTADFGTPRVQVSRQTPKIITVG